MLGLTRIVVVQVEEGKGLEHLWGIKGTGIIDGLDFK